jgi:hypothetical protein
MLSSFLILIIQTPPSGDSYLLKGLKGLLNTYLPHGYTFIPEKEHIDISGQLRWLLQIYEVLEE